MVDRLSLHPAVACKSEWHFCLHGFFLGLVLEQSWINGQGVTLSLARIDGVGKCLVVLSTVSSCTHSDGIQFNSIDPIHCQYSMLSNSSYGGQDGETVNESSPTSDPGSSPRVARLIHAEEATLANVGACLRLAGLYTKERGAHSFWLNSGKDVSGREDGIINLVHYDDAASACLAALQVGSDVVSGKVFLISDGNPTTRRGIVEAALTNDLYKDKTMPAFLGGESDPKGKVYDGSYSNKALKWTPTHESFSSFMKSA